jgi:SprT protein
MTQVSQELKAKVEARIEECYQIAESHFGCKFIRPTLTYNVRGQVAGRAGVWQNVIKLNPVLLNHYQDEFIARTVGHEIAHIVADTHFNQSCNHGRLWKFVMRLFGQEASRCHDYDLRLCSTRKTFTYACNCMEHHITSNRHNKIVRKGATYTCRKCDTRLTFVKANQ